MPRITHQPRPREEAYFHSGNSGVTFRLTERQLDWTKSSPSEEIKAEVERSEFEYRFEVTHGAFGENSRMSFPLSPCMVDFLIGAFTNLKQRMEEVPARETAFERNTSPLRSLHFTNGLKVEQVYGPEVVTDPYSSASYFLGTRLLDPMSGAEVAFIPFDGEGEQEGRFSGGCSDASGTPLYREEDIGKPVTEVERIKPSRPIQPGIDTLDTDLR